LLCLYCHDNEHHRLLEASGGVADIGNSNDRNGIATHSPFANLKSLLNKGGA
jgi:hypothetical protein